MRTCLVALLVALAIVASGCGSNKPKNAADWADAFCSNVTTWKDSLTSAKDEFAANPSKETLKQAADDIKKATDTFRDDTKGLGKPPTEDGAQAQQAVEQLSNQLHSTQETISTAVKSVDSVNNALNAASIVTTNLQTLKDSATATFDKLNTLNPGGELEKAFKQSSTCQSLGL